MTLVGRANGFVTLVDVADESVALEDGADV